MPTQTQVTNLLDELYKYAPSSIIEMFVIDLTPFATYYNIGSGEGVRIFRYFNGYNERIQQNLSNTNIIWDTKTYYARPIQFSGLEISSAGQVPTPRLEISDIDLTLSPMIQAYGGMVGAEVLRKRTLVKFLDAGNFITGTNPTADPNSAFPDDKFRVERVAEESNGQISFELSPAWDVEGVQLPRRQVVANICPWTYKQSPCNWDPTADGRYYNELDQDLNDTDLFPGLTLQQKQAQDRCSKRVNGCRLRFGSRIMPFGGFPSAGLYGKPL